MGQLPRDFPDFRQLSTAERTRLAEELWERFVAAHPESRARSFAPVQEFARPELDDRQPVAAQSRSGARPQQSAARNA